MKGDAEGGAAWGRASGRGSPQRGGGAGRAMGVRHAGDILRRCPQKGLWPGGGGGRGHQSPDDCMVNTKGCMFLFILEIFHCFIT